MPNKSWLTFLESEINDVKATKNLKSAREVKVKKTGFLKVEINYLQNRSLILLNSSKSQSNLSTSRRLVCPSLYFAPLPNNCQKCFYLPQSGAKKSVIRFTTKATEDFLAIVVDNLPNLAWLLIDKKIPYPILGKQEIYDLWEYLNNLDKNNLQIFYQSFEVK